MIPSRQADLPVDVAGTAFQQAVWAALSDIPAGETRTYGQVAAAVGRPAAVRAAGTACGDNSLAVLIPCHRVLRTDGTLGGYAYGLERKASLLDRERAAGTALNERRRSGEPNCRRARLIVRTLESNHPSRLFATGGKPAGRGPVSSPL